MTCEHCGCEEIAWVDEGIGQYEYWGATGYDTKMVPVCRDCGEYVECDTSFNQWKADQYEDREPDDYYEYRNY